MSAFKKFAGLVAGVSAVGAIGVAVAQGVPPNPAISNPALGAGQQSSQHTLIGETGVLPESNLYVQQTATLTKEADQAPVASAQPSSADTSQQVAQAPSQPDNSASNTQSLGAGPAPSDDTGAQKAPRHDRG